MTQRHSAVTSIGAAIDLVEDGCTIGIGGLLNSSHAMPAVREIIRRRLRGLRAVGLASGLEIDMLIAAGCVDRVATPTVSGETIKAIGPAFRKRAQEGTLDIWECDEGLIYAAIQAGAQQVPYTLWRGGLGTDYPNVNPGLRLVDDEFTGGPVLAVEAISVDVCFLHAARSDPFGNVQHEAGGFGDRALGRASRVVAVTVEQLVANEQIRREPELTSIPGADLVVLAPYGSHPFACPGSYIYDEAVIREWVVAAEQWRRTDDYSGVDSFFNRYVFKPDSHEAYLEEVGLRRLLSLHESHYVAGAESA